jgi:hypothetical protein
MWFRLPKRNTLRSRENRDVLLKTGLACVSLSFFSFFRPRLKWRLLEPFIAQGRTVTMSFKARQVASRQVKPYAVWRQWPGVAYDIFNGVSTSGLVACSIVLSQQHGVVMLRRCALQRCLTSGPQHWHCVAIAL